jgi:branched-chain amino acid transport system ATP-binding protein
MNPHPTDPQARRPTLTVKELHSGYGEVEVLRGISMEVPPSGAVALLGANGAGKTTLLKTLSGLLPAAKGQVQLGDDDVTNLAPHLRQRKGLCYIPEGRGIFRSLTVRQNLILQTTPKHEDEALGLALEAFPLLQSRLSQIAGTLSGGEQQMLAMSQAYISHPDLLLVDEPSLGLAPTVVDRIFEFLQTINAQGTAVLLVDQFVGLALQLADAAYVLRKGEIVFSGPAGELAEGDVLSTYFGTGSQPI